MNAKTRKKTSNITERLGNIYHPKLNQKLKNQLFEALRLLIDALDKANTAYVLYAGSLVGSWRHHDMVPWDDDIDITVNFSIWESIEQLQIPGHSLINATSRTTLYKFFNENATKISGRPWKWPNIDLFFFIDNGTHIYDPVCKDLYVYERSDIFPVSQRLFGPLVIKAPRNTKKVLSQNYDVDVCKTGSYNHRFDKGNEYITVVNCSHLHRFYPFVQRGDNSKTEKLFFNGKIVSQFSYI